ncbi:MAG TPA: Gfo/Idh/MocA family oxidoreductase [Phycisphaerales bacterium]
MSKKAKKTSSATGSSVQSAPRTRYAVVGLGHIAQAAVLPAFSHARSNSELVALVSSDDKKLQELGKMYKLSALYGYDGLEECIAQEKINAVYIATPNSEHVPMVEAAARAGAHVLCEKPLGVTERECRRMIDVCEEAGVKLMTAYRLHFDPANLRAIEVVKAGDIGEPRHFVASFTYQIKDGENIRLQAKYGGGPLLDIGIYCVNAARSLFRAEPVEVHAWSTRSKDARFREVDETVIGMLRFPGDRTAVFTCSFGLSTSSWFELLGTEGGVCLDNAFDYSEKTEITVTKNDKSRTSVVGKRDQFAAELIYFSDCIQNKRAPEPSGWEGLADVRVLQALRQSIARETPLLLRPSRFSRHPSPQHRIVRPPVPREPKLVNAASASE